MERLLEILVIGLAAWRPLRAAASPRVAAAFPHAVPRLRLALAVVALGGAAVALFMPMLLRAGALVAFALFVAERVRAHPRWGRTRGLPPGSLGIFPDNWSDDRFFLEQAQRHGPIFKTSHFLRPEIGMVGLSHGIALLKHHDEQLSLPKLPFSDYVPGGLLRYMGEADHRHYRSVFRVAYSPPMFEPHVSRVEATTRRALVALRDRSEACGGGVAPLPDLDRLMMDLWLPLFFAIEPESSQAAELRSLYPIIHINNPSGASRRQIHTAVKRISTIVEEERGKWSKTSPPPCILSHVAAGWEDGDSDPVVIGNLLYILHTSSTDLSALLLWLLKMMSDHPEWLERMADADEPLLPLDASSIANRIVMETLRLRQSEFIYRAVREEFEFEGYRFPKGWLVRICVWESHRDPTVFDDPDAFHPDRFLGRSFTRREYSPFGAQRHACLGPQLATLVGSVFVRELARGFKLDVTSDGPIELGSFRHWTPSSAYQIRLRARA